MTKKVIFQPAMKAGKTVALRMATARMLGGDYLSIGDWLKKHGEVARL